MRLKLPELKSRPAQTLLFVTEVKTFRVDTDRKGKLLTDVECIEHGCNTPERLPKVVQKIAEQSAPLGKKVWLIFLRLPLLLISVPSMQVQGVNAETLMQALQFESEGMTGITSQGKQMAYRFIKSEHEMSDYLAVQVDQLVMDDLRQVLKKLKSELAGLLHPGALPRALHAADASEWLRIESWSNQLVAVFKEDGRQSMQVLGFDNQHWLPELEQWLQDLGSVAPSETLLNNRLEMLPKTEHQWHLNESDHLAVWLGAWAEVLTGPEMEQVALLRQQSKINMDIAWMVGTGVMGLLLCALHAGWFTYQKIHFENENTRLKNIEKNMQDVRKQLSELTDQKDKLEDKLKKLTGDADAIPNTIKQLQQREVLLLRSLAEGRDNELIIESIESSKSEIVVGGVTLKQHLGNQLATFLQPKLKPANWEVQPPIKEDMKLFAEGAGPWSFKLSIKDTGIPGFTQPDKTKAVKP